MPCGLYGKLPAKRDFIAVNMPREFLTCWETWLHGAMTASRLFLGNRWLPAYLGAPLWRFSLGADICGVPVAGVFMSSVDGVGRHFPLTIFYCAEQSDRIDMPSSAALSEWYDTMETFLLSALEADLDYDVLLEKLNLLPACAKQPAEPADASVLNAWKGHVKTAMTLDDLGPAFESIEAEEERLRRLRKSFWCTIGGADHEALAIAADGLPDPDIMSVMLTGQLDETQDRAG